MMWFKKLLRLWVTQAVNAELPKPTNDFGALVASQGNRPESPPQCQINLRKAMNGWVLELGQYKPQARGNDWHYSFFVLDDTDDLPAAIAALLVKQKLEG